MWKWRVAILLVGLIGASPIIALNVWGIRMSMWSAEVQNENLKAIEAIENGEPREVAAKRVTVPEMPRSPLDFVRGMRERRQTLSTDDFNNERRFHFSKTIRFEDILESGETPPDEIFQPLWVEARAQRLLAPECELLLGTIASKCVVATSETRQLSSGLYSVRAEMHYIPSYQIGEVKRQSGYEFNMAQVNLDRSDIRTPPPADTPEQRMAHIRTAVNLCDHVRETYGTCVITSVDFSLKEPRSGGPTELSTRIRLSAYMPGNLDQMRAFDAFVKEAYAALD